MVDTVDANNARPDRQRRVLMEHPVLEAADEVAELDVPLRGEYGWRLGLQVHQY